MSLPFVIITSLTMVIQWLCRLVCLDLVFTPFLQRNCSCVSDVSPAAPQPHGLCRFHGARNTSLHLRSLKGP